MSTPGEITGHYFRCPHCNGYAALDTHRCSSCGAQVEAILWSPPDLPVSPELVMVSR